MVRHKSKTDIFRAYLKDSGEGWRRAVDQALAGGAAKALLGDGPQKTGVGAAGGSAFGRQTVVRPPSLTRGKAPKSGRPVSEKRGGHGQ